MDYPDIASKIISLRDADLELREALTLRGKLQDGYDEEMAKIHKANAEALQTIIDEIGYPNRVKVGVEGSSAAWLIIQHAIGSPQFMRACCKLLEAEAESGNADPQSLAYLQDRIAVFEGRLQLYGTQYDWDENGEMSPNPMADEANVNDRRAAIGLLSIQEQTKIMRQRLKAEFQSPPEDLQRRSEAYEEWRRLVGWIE